jgi:ribose 5-phosphate isomerase A
MDAQQQFKQASAEAAVALVEDGMILGLGTGSTAKLAVAVLGKRVGSGLRVTGIPTSEFTAQQARSLGIPISTVDEHPEIAMTIDGADEVELGTLNLIKGRGGALLREKIVASASKRLTIIVDESKLVDKLGSHFALPVELVPFGWPAAARRIEALGAKVTLRTGAEGKTFVTDGGHYIVDCEFGPIPSPAQLDQELNSIVGVVEHGLFLGMATQVIVAGANGVKTLFSHRA